MPKAKATRRADGRYQRKVYLGTDEAGKKKYRYLYGATAKEVDRKAEELLYTLHKGTDILSGDLAFSRWAERYLRLKEGKVSEVYYVGLKGRMDFWCREVGDVPLSKVTRSGLQIALDELAVRNPRSGKATSLKTLRDYKLAAAGVFELAMVDRAVTYNPANYLEVSHGAPKKTRRALTEEEQGWILNTPHRAQTAAMILLLAGLRRGELLALRVGDVDLQAATLTVDKSVKFVGGQPVIKHGGKTNAAARTIHIPTALVEYLRPIMAGQSPFALLVPGKDGEPMTEAAFRRMWESYTSELNLQHGKFTQDIKSKFDPRIKQVIPDITPHLLRHTYASNLVMAGVDVATAQYLLGHSDVKTTLGIYTHISTRHAATQIDKLDEYLGLHLGIG